MLFSNRISFLDQNGAPFPAGSWVPRTVRAEVMMSNSQLDDISIEKGTRFSLTEGTHPVADGVVEVLIDTEDYDC